MKYQVYNHQTNNFECEFDNQFEAHQFIESEFGWETHGIVESYECREIVIVNEDHDKGGLLEYFWRLSEDY